MKIIKNVIALILCIVTLSMFFTKAYADGASSYSTVEKAEATALDLSNDHKKSGLSVTAEKAVLYEASTKTIIYKKGANEKVPVSYLTKLMTILLTAERLKTDKDFTLDKKLITSAAANSKQGSQIWLDVGEKISVKELLKSVTIGNANDACVVLAEGIAGNEKSFVKAMNNRAKSLGMKNTKFVDCTGISESNISTAKDIAILSAELLKHKNLKGFFTKWMDSVRGGKAELVNLNTLVRNYKGISGLKACGSDKAGNCIVASATRNELSLIAVALKTKDSDSRAVDAQKMLDFGFEGYDIYAPEIPKDAVEPINVTHGFELKTDTYVDGAARIVVKRGTAGNISVSCNRVGKLEAPVAKNTKVGELVLKMGSKELMKRNIYTKNEVKRIDIAGAFSKLLLSLLRN